MSFNTFTSTPLLISIWEVANDGICHEVASWATHQGLQVLNPIFPEDDYVAWTIWAIANGYIQDPSLYLMSLVLTRGNQGIVRVFDTPVGLDAKHPNFGSESPAVVASVPNLTSWPPRSK